MMKKCSKPCNECPFTKNSIPGWLADYSPEELHSIIMQEVTFPCHLTHDIEIEWKYAGTDEYPLCAGALMYLKKTGKEPIQSDFIKLLSEIDIKECDNILSQAEFFRHHAIKKK